MTRSPASDSAPLFEQRPGERRLDIDPSSVRPDAGLVFIGRIRSPWIGRDECPKNMAAARDKGGGATVELDPAYRAGLEGLEGYSHVVLLTWLHHAPRDLIVQKPRHAETATGTFALRSPARPNPIGLHVARLLRLDRDAGTLALEAIDVLDGTPLVDIKPYFASADAVSEATRPDRPAR